MISERVQIRKHADSLEDSCTVHLAADWKIVILIHLLYQPISVKEKKRNHLGIFVWYPRRLLDISFYLFQRITAQNTLPLTPSTASSTASLTASSTVPLLLPYKSKHLIL